MSKEASDKAFDNTLKRMLNTPPKKSATEKQKKAKEKKPSSK